MTRQTIPGKVGRRAGAGVLGALVAGVALLSSAPARAQHQGHDMGAMTKDPKMAPQSQQTMMQGMMQDVRELRALRGDDRERTYLTKMMDHHQSGIDMARMAVQKAQSPALKAEARQIIEEQGKEIGQMRQHLASSHKINRTAKPDPRMQPMMEKLQRLSGAEFDRAFAQEMSMHHQGAIDMSNVVVQGGVPHRPIKTLAGKIVRSNKKSQKDLAQAVRSAPRPRTASSI